ncbi:histidine--tRNA ligase [Candidatus Solincola sp.]|nr:histidine--tRNA ligase [Actinomycetota bacterium]MDI7251904.1 histidine--tRNA ligase [Actinomycetota bacterium]
MKVWGEEKARRRNSADFRAPRGTQDVLPPESERWRRVLDLAHRLFHAYGYREIILPVMEYTEVFARGLGEGTDIVRKEMFTFLDKGGRSLTLRPEATAGVARAFVQHRLDKGGLPVKLYYCGPMFRHERPQAGRYRQFHQLGVELIGSPYPSADAEVILLCHEFLGSLGIASRLVVNSVGDAACRPAYVEALRGYLEGRAGELCPDCRRRMEVNTLRVLDCKERSCAPVIAGAPGLGDYLCGACRAHLRAVEEILGAAGVDFSREERLVRGLDYYTRTVFEFQDPELGGQNALAAGGRYDHLVEEMGGEPVPAVGFSVGLERVMNAGPVLPEGGREGVYLVAIGEEARRRAFLMARGLRAEGLRCDLDHMDRSPKAQMKEADRQGYRYCLILGEDELKGDYLTLRDLEEGAQERLEAGGNRWLEAVKERLGR